MDISLFTSCKERVLANCGKVIVGKDEAITLVFTSFLCSGHVLLEDVPGTGKTMLLRAFSKTIGGKFKRIQFTPDLLPSDLTGINFYNQKTGEFQFREGPLFSNIILADEINRATPRTQSSLLEAMEERQISVDGTTTRLEEPFMVMATQNPLESYGTFPLPEAQLDRFIMQIPMGYPNREGEREILHRFAADNPLLTLESVCTKEELAAMQKQCEEVYAAPVIEDYILDLVEATRKHNNIALGVSPRGALVFLRAAKCYSALKGEHFVTPETVKYLAPFVLSHRLILEDVYSTNKKASDYIEEITHFVTAPTEDFAK